MTPYQYVHNNPVNLIDPTGMSADGWYGKKQEDGSTTWKFDNEISTESMARAKYGDDTEFYAGGNRIFNEKGSGRQVNLTTDGGVVPVSNNQTSFAGIAGVTTIGGMSSTLSSSAMLLSSAMALAIASPLALTGDSDPSLSIPFYRAMSANEWNNTQGYLSDRNTTGEGPHVRADLGYLLNAKFINGANSKYDYIVQYDVYVHRAEQFLATPFYFNPENGTKGGPVFNSARAAGMNYIKYEKGFSFGFPGASTSIFNSSLRRKPRIIQNIR